jgi:OOP family OmpA-OmpF porin
MLPKNEKKKGGFMMVEKKCFKFVIPAIAAAFLFMSCAVQKPMQQEAVFEAVDLNSKLACEYVQKVNTFLVILDASGTMVHESYKGRPKLALAKDLVSRLNQTIPDLELMAGLRTFGQSFSEVSTDLVYGLGDYSKDALGQALEGVEGGGFTPLGHAVFAANEDLNAAKGQTAVIIVSDGKETDMQGLSAAKAIKSQLGGRVCIYTVVVGDCPDGTALLQEVARAGACGSSVNADNIMSAGDMAGFVEEVFLARAPDSDGDGVPDPCDKCPDTPRGMGVDANGCPLEGPPPPVMDSDGDGVPDSRDQCPNTPKGARVNEVGCWVYETRVLFDFDSYDIRPEARGMLDEAVSILNQNPGIMVELQGHTCNIAPEAYNQTLSEERAKAVMNYLMSKGISMDRLSAVGYGESQPVSSNDTREGRAKNRRVQLNPVY